MTRFSPDSCEKNVLCDQCQNLPLNSLNDVSMHCDRSIWFTDPCYASLQGFRNEPAVGDSVYRCDPQGGEARVVAASFVKPQGLAFSPDEHSLSVTDSGAIREPRSYHVHKPHHIRRFDVGEEGRLGNDVLFVVISPGIPDGITLDTQGRVHVSSASGVQLLSPAGELLGQIITPAVANFVFGGLNNNLLFILTDVAIRVATLAVKGVPYPA
ncbi:MAG: SMP-30/gluconolactonase/LRE family protein [Gammaproteobacteria bacterium]